ncbi:hypothetical protein N7533_008570 [Penicillium manginii]|uniref:uncharacterized protein n=1 Tax=Penicillium manginii TaxID=203109 RepID=UPI0025478029|nr:uncharacterized protein N7533_008570 [Penicillium manginii]KAJ5743700.1 hypothetical protein N7533_008570 [Penicillium manginii]
MKNLNESWEAYKPEITRLYMAEGKSKKKVMQIMESTHGFVASNWQYGAQFEKWRFKKYHGGRRAWIYIRERCKKARIEKKPHPNVSINGVFKSPRSVQIGIRRHAYESTIQSLHSASLPSTPEGVVVCSPEPACWPGLQWPSDLPWFTFSRQLSILDVKFDPPTSTTEESLKFKYLGCGYDISHRTLIPLTPSPANLSQGPDSLTFEGYTSRVVETLRCFMPEEHEGQHEATAQSLQTDSSFFELSISLYMFSNDIPLINYSKKSLPTPSDNRRNEFMVIRNILRKAKLDDAENMKSLLASQDLTTEVIAHKIFRASVEMRDNEMMRIMLEAGMWPDAPLLIDKFHGTALQHISGMLPREVACGLARILLSHGASTDPKNAGEPPLARAIDSDNTALFNLLVAHGAKPSPQALRMAVSRKSWVKIIIPYFQMLYDAGVDLKSTTVDGKTLLGIAKDDVLTKWLVDHGCDVNAPQICELQNDSYEWVNHITSPLGIAAADGKLAVMRVLLEAGANINSPPGANVSVSPLFLAVYSSEINSVRFLIQAGANIESADQFKMLHEATRKTLIERAWHRQDLCLALLRSGAYASSNEKMNILHFPMIMAVRARDSTLARDLLSLGAPINPFDRRSSITAIALAIMNGDIEMISLLKDSGASIGGLEIPSVHDVRTAEYLESVGWLPEILSWNRAQILASAIGRYDETLVSFLLQKGNLLLWNLVLLGLILLYLIL